VLRRSTVRALVAAATPVPLLSGLYDALLVLHRSGADSLRYTILEGLPCIVCCLLNPCLASIVQDDVSAEGAMKASLERSLALRVAPSLYFSEFDAVS
jgi:hypothetical protein